ncbi:hypothetical protein CISIN_1g0280352mg, partial [Citrus sinensis]
WKNNAKLQLPA